MSRVTCDRVPGSLIKKSVWGDEAMTNMKYLPSDVVLRLERMLETLHTCNTSLQRITGCHKKLIIIMQLVYLSQGACFQYENAHFHFCYDKNVF